MCERNLAIRAVRNNAAEAEESPIRRLVAAAKNAKINEWLSLEFRAEFFSMHSTMSTSAGRTVISPISALPSERLLELRAILQYHGTAQPRIIYSRRGGILSIGVETTRGKRCAACQLSTA
jgi:hypothetical protein